MRAKERGKKLGVFVLTTNHQVDQDLNAKAGGGISVFLFLLV